MHSRSLIGPRKQTCFAIIGNPNSPLVDQPAAARRKASRSGTICGPSVLEMRSRNHASPAIELSKARGQRSRSGIPDCYHGHACHSLSRVCFDRLKPRHKSKNQRAARPCDFQSLGWMNRPYRERIHVGGGVCKQGTS